MSNYSLGIPAFYILFALTGGDRHGYGIMKDVLELSEGSVQVGPATLYTNIRKLLDKGLLRESGERVSPELDDQRRRYYCLTTEGLALVRSELNRMNKLITTFKMRTL